MEELHNLSECFCGQCERTLVCQHTPAEGHKVSLCDDCAGALSDEANALDEDTEYRNYREQNDY